MGRISLCLCGGGTVRRWLGLPLLLVACGAEPAPLPPPGQILLFIDTDAPLPAAPGSIDTDDPPPLFDHLRVDVGLAEELANDTPHAERDFVVHCGSFDDGPLSLGIAPPLGAGGYAVRLRLYRAADAIADVAATSSSIDYRVALPEVADEGVVRLLVTLRVDDTARPRSFDATELERDVPASASIGAWPGAARVPCSEPAGPGEACVPGGAFWMGDPELRNDTEVENAEREHLVVISPFFIDTHEVTVGELRAVEPQLRDAGVALPPIWSGESAGGAEDDYSTFTTGPSDADPFDARAELPVNAVTWETARAYCRALGKDLPSESMFEFLASGRGLEQKYVWGDDAPDCADAVSGRAGFGVYATFDGACRPSGSPGGVLAAGAGSSDRAELPEGEVLDLAGNLSEWALDWFNAEDEGVWAEAGVAHDPIALDQGRAGARRSVRGGSWRGRYVELRAAARVARDPNVVNRSLGFRCARRP